MSDDRNDTPANDAAASAASKKPAKAKKARAKKPSRQWTITIPRWFAEGRNPSQEEMLSADDIVTQILAKKPDVEALRKLGLSLVVNERGRQIIWSPNVKLLSHAIDYNEAMNAQANQAESTESPSGQFLPHELQALLELRIIGQKASCRRLAAAVYKHRANVAVRGMSKEELSQFGGLSVKDVKTQILLIHGGTGVGKTYQAEVLADILGMPVTVYNSLGDISSTGFVGKDISDIYLTHFKNVKEWLLDKGDRRANDNEYVAEWISANQSILVIDEIDKISASPGVGKDITGSTLQSELLTAMGGSEVTFEVPDENGTHRSRRGGGAPVSELSFSPRNMLWVLCGAFNGVQSTNTSSSDDGDSSAVRSGRPSLVDLVRGRVRNASLPEDTARFRAEAVDFVKYGMMPEFMGRVTDILPCRDLSEEDMFRVLLTSKGNALCSFKASLSKYRDGHGFEVVTDDEALRAIAKKAVSLKTGARALETVMSGVSTLITSFAARQPKDVTVFYLSKELVELVYSPDNVEGDKIVESGPKATFQKKNANVTVIDGGQPGV